MKLFFDARYIRTDYHDGISRYSRELAHALARITPVTFIICDKAQLKELPEHAEHIIIHPPTSVKEPLTALILNKYHPDVVFSPLQTMGSFGRRFKLILTLHDMIYYRHRTPPHQYNFAIRAGWRLFHLSYVPGRLALNGADVVATVSETSKRQFEAVNLTKRPVVVIPNAPQKLRQYLSGDTKPGGKPKHIVYMGSFMPYKNVETLIRGMAFLPGYTLHLLSRITPKRHMELQKLVPKGSNVVFHRGVSDQKYAELLADRAILASASLDEGYGLPLAEAIELGVPAVVSDLPIFHEVAGEGALYFEPTSPEDFARKVRELEHSPTRARVIQAGAAHISQYSWDASARKLHAAIKHLLVSS